MKILIPGQGIKDFGELLVEEYIDANWMGRAMITKRIDN